MEYCKRSNQSDTDARPRKKRKVGLKEAKKRQTTEQLSKALMDVLPTMSTRPPTIENRTLVTSLPDVWKTSNDLGLRLFIFLCDDQTIQKLLRATSLVSGSAKKKLGATDPLLVLNVLFNAWTRAGEDYQKTMEERYHDEKGDGGPAFREITGDSTAVTQAAGVPAPCNAARAGPPTGGSQAAAAKPSSMKPLGLAGGASSSSSATAGRPVAGAFEPAKVLKAMPVDLNNNGIADALPPMTVPTGAKVPACSQPKAAVVEPFFSVPDNGHPAHNNLQSATTSAVFALPHGSQNPFTMHATVAAGNLAMAAVTQPPTYIHGKTASRLHAHHRLPTGTALKAVQLIAPHDEGHCSKPPFSALLEFCAQRKLSTPIWHVDQVPGATFPRFQATITFHGENFKSSLKTSKQSAKTEAAQMALNAVPRLLRGK